MMMPIFNMVGGGGKPEEEKTVSAPDFSAGNIEVNPTTGKVMTKVTVNKDTTNHIAGNIKKDVSLYGVVGTLEEGTGGGATIYKVTIRINLTNASNLSPFINLYKNDTELTIISWGDGSSNNTSTTSGTQDVSHTYSAIGSYVITITSEGSFYFDSYCVGSTTYTAYIVDIIFGDNISYIGYRAVMSSAKMTGLVLPEGITEIGAQAFKYGAFAKVVIPKTVTTMGASCFYGGGVLATVVVLAATPPTLADVNTFAYNAATRNFYVPDASVDTYKAATNWSTFSANIYAISTL